VTTAYDLRCRECGKSYGVQPLSICDDCFSPLEVVFDLDYARTRFTRQAISQGPLNMWRYRALLPVADSYEPQTPAGFTPLMKAPRLGAHIGARNLYIKNDAVCLPTLSFKDRVVAVALANAQAFGFDTVGCSSTGNLANAVAAGAARLGLKTFILVPSDLEPAKILNTQVYGATLVRIEGNYDHCNRLCSQIADRYNWGFVNVNLRPYYAEGSKTVGFEIAEQLGWRLPDTVSYTHLDVYKRQVYSALLSLEGEKAIALVANYLEAGDDLAAEAAFALADMRTREALAALIDRLRAGVDTWFGSVLFSAIALTLSLIHI